MSTENDNVNLDTTTDVSGSHSEPVIEKVEPKVEPRFNREEKTDKSIRTLLKTNIEKIKEEEETLPMTSKERKAKVESTPEPKKELSKTSSEKKEEVVDTKAPKESKSEETVPPTPSQAAGIPAPAALTKEEKQLWDNTPPEIQKAFMRREEDTQKGIEKLKATYKPIEDALAPIRPLLAQRGMTEGHAVKQLFDWHAALSSSDRGSQLAAFRALAQSHGVDIRYLVPQQPAPQPQVQVQNQPPVQDSSSQDPLATIQPYLEQTLRPIQQQLSVYEAQLHNQRMDAANKELSTFAVDKPHFERVRTRMAEIMQTAVNFGRPVDLQQAYDEAVWGMPELRAEILQGEEAKRQAEFQAQQDAMQKKLQEEFLAKQKKEEEELSKKKELEMLEKAKRAYVSPRSTTPVGAVSSKQPRGAQSVADTLRATMKQLNTTI